MALGTNHMTVTTAANFIPELWSDETLALYKQRLVMGNLVTKINFKGKKGDTLHIPVPARGSATAKAANTVVSFVADTAGVVNVLIDKHYEYSSMFEDIAEAQSLASMRRFYTDAASYGLSKQVDQDLQLLGHYLNSGNTTPAAANLFETAVIGGDGTTAFSGASSGNGTALTDAGLRAMIQHVEDDDVNSGECNLVIPPVEANVLRGIARFTEQAFVGDGSVIKTGRLGNLYGVEVYTSTNCPYIHCNSVTNTQSVNFTGTSLAAAGTAYTDAYGIAVNWTASTPTDTQYRAGMLVHKDAFALAEQIAIRTQSQYKVEYLGTAVVSDTVYGVKTLREYAGIAFVVPK
jgi:hypothetical protein